jgi:hypothetical protein
MVSSQYDILRPVIHCDSETDAYRALIEEVRRSMSLSSDRKMFSVESSLLRLSAFARLADRRFVPTRAVEGVEALC